MAKNWHKIVKKVPNAKLNIIGSGQVHSRNTKLGDKNIAEENYEKLIFKYLERKGIPKDSYRFYGILGTEKSQILKSTTVGIVNPTGKTETFGLSVSEFNLSGVPVVTKRVNGLFDTLINKYNGLNYILNCNFHKKVIKLLIDNKLNTKLGLNGYEYVTSQFNIDLVVSYWNDLFRNIHDGKKRKNKV